MDSRLSRSDGLPVNGDFEDGYGDTLEDVAATVEAAVESGLAGIGVEDTSAIPICRSATSTKQSPCT